jgi:hypothetical protein
VELSRNRFTDRRFSPSVTQMDVTLLMPDLADNGAPLTNCPVTSRPSLKVRLPVSNRDHVGPADLPL